MAKFYYSFADLLEIGKKMVCGQIDHKPGGTLGRHYMTLRKNSADDKIVVCGKSSSGENSKEITIKPGDTLGYDCGKIWRVPSPEKYKDPIRRVLAERHISQGLLEFSNNPVNFSNGFEKFPEGSCADSSRGTFPLAVMGKYEEFIIGELPYDEKFGSYRDCQINGGEVIVLETVTSRDTTHHRARRISSVVVRPTADKKKVAEFLRNL